MASTVKRTACTECNSSNNLCWFQKDNGELTSKCLTPDCTYRHQRIVAQENQQRITMTTNYNTNNELITDGWYEDLTDRGISEETCRQYLIQVGELNGKKIHIYNYTNKTGDIISQKIRFIDTKEFIWRQNSNEKQLFGANSITSGITTEKIYITEGEPDAVSLAEVGIRNAISISTGAGDQTENEIRRHLEVLEHFNKVILVFDNDKVGQDTAKKIAKLFTPGKVYLVNLRYKDPNEYLQQGKQLELIEDINNHYLYTPECISQPILEDMLKPAQIGLNIQYPELNKVIKGIKPGRIYTLLAGSGAGKSTFTKEILYNLINTYPELTVGAVYLEEPKDTTGLSFVALDNNIPLHELEENPTQLGNRFNFTYEKYITSGRVRFLDASFMKLEGRELTYNLNFLAIGLNCKVIVLDHLTMVTYDMQSEQSERKDIDMLMKSLRELTHRTQCSIILVSHLKRPAFGKSWAEGREINMTDSRGSAAIEQLSDVILALERNMLDEINKNKTRIKVLKNRITGKTGYVDDLFYDELTGRLITVGQLFK